MLGRSLENAKFEAGCNPGSSPSIARYLCWRTRLPAWGWGASAYYNGLLPLTRALAFPSRIHIALPFFPIVGKNLSARHWRGRKDVVRRCASSSSSAVNMLPTCIWAEFAIVDVPETWISRSTVWATWA